MVRIAGGNYTSMAATGGVVAIHIKVILFRMVIAFYFSSVLSFNLFDWVIYMNVNFTIVVFPSVDLQPQFRLP